MCKLGKELNAKVNALCTVSTLKSTSSALRAISAVAELLVLVAYQLSYISLQLLCLVFSCDTVK